MIVADTSALIGAWHAHYLPSFVPAFWEQLEAAMTDGRIIVSELVYIEAEDQSDGLFGWLKERKALVVAPTGDVQRRAGELQQRFRFKPGRDGADPFLIAEAELRGYSLATYEGVSPTGSRARAKRDVDDMPTICEALGVDCLQPALAWRDAGLSLS